MSEHIGRPGLPLQGVTVLTVEHAVAAPFATRQLADLGARVIKVERPGNGDFARDYDNSVNGSSSYFTWLNRSKESIELDLKSPAGQQVLSSLVQRSDVIVQNLGPGAAARLGLAADDVRAADPGKIVVGITGWGSDGPWATRKAYDLLVQCETGLVSLTGSPDSAAKVGVSIADIAAGMYAFSGILAALYQRQVTGIGASIEVPLFDALAEWVSQPAYFTAGAGRQPARSGSHHATIAPYGPYKTTEGRTVLLAVQNQPEWQLFCTGVLRDPDLSGDSRFHTNTGRVRHREELDAIICAELARLDLNELERRLTAARIAFSSVKTVKEFLEHPVLAARNRWRIIDSETGPIPALLPPIDFGVPPRMGPVPALGEHTDQILAELGHHPLKSTAVVQG